MHTPIPSAAHCRDAIGALAAAGLGAAAGPARSQVHRLRGAGHVVLLGDSSFDNKAYIGGQPDVLAHLRGQLPHPWRATLAAVDGAVAGDVQGQLARVPADATHLVISVGGNTRSGGKACSGSSRGASARVQPSLRRCASVSGSTMAPCSARLSGGGCPRHSAPSTTRASRTRCAKGWV